MANIEGCDPNPSMFSQAAREVYERLGASSNVEAILEPGVGHAITPAMLAKARSFFRKHLLDNVKDPSEGHATLATL